ncbi:hypothetical protein ACFHWW_26965 [Ensifer sp. P24N7]|uniref:hypothetical protein n=1 Tax=Sinorhizobium sp. P24N7 TaxID=3348358 RepID=UPI0035F2AD4C
MEDVWAIAIRLASPAAFGLAGRRLFRTFEPVNLVVFVNALTNRTQKPHGHPEPGLWESLKGLIR